MHHDNLLAPEAVEDLGGLEAKVRAEVQHALERHLRHEPTKTSRTCIRRLHGLSRPQFRLRVGSDIRVFYDVAEATVEVLAIFSKSEANAWLARYGESDEESVLTQLTDELSKYLRLAEKEQIVITRHGQPAGILVGFASEDDWFDYQLENDPRFIQRVDRARASIRNGRGVPLEDL